VATARPSAGYQLTLLLLSAGLVALVLQSLNLFWRMELPLGQPLALAAAGALWGWLWWRSRALGLLTTLGAGLALFLAARKVPEVSRWALRAAAEAAMLVRELAGGNLGATFGPSLGAVLIVLAAAGAGLVVTGEALGRGRAVWTLALGFLLFGTQWGWYFEPAAGYFQAYAVLSLLVWVLGQAALREARWRAEGRHLGRRSPTTPAIAAVLGIALAAGVLPSHFRPVNLGELGRRLQTAVPALQQFRGAGASVTPDFTLASTGFAPELGRLGGAVNLDNRVALRIAVNGPLTGALYVRGAAFVTYTGSSWERVESPEVEPQGGQLPSQMGEVTMRRSLVAEITPVLSFGRTIFHVLEPARIEGLAGYTADAEANLLARRPIAPGATYTVTARVPVYSAVQIRETPPYDPDLHLQPASGYGPSLDLEPVSGDGPAPDPQRYLQVPEMPRRVGQLARRLAEGIEHPYDQAVAIESYLRRMPYTLNPKPAPPRRDFVDFFLFDLQEGYCTYYASAMVVMLRELGIPARFVEGYAIRASAPFTVDDRGWRVYEARNSQAHAWVEAYFPGYGWVTFDPTPRADLPVISRNAAPPSPSLDEPAPGDATDTPDPGSETTNATSPSRPHMEQEEPEIPIFDGAAPAAARRDWTWLSVPPAAAAALALLVARVLRAQERFRYRDARSVVQEAWEKSAWLLARFGLSRRPHQTAREYAEHVAGALPSLREEVLQAAADYSAARYGPPGRPVPPEHAQRARAFWQRAKDALFDRYGWRVYLWRRLGWRPSAEGRSSPGRPRFAGWHRRRS